MFEGDGLPDKICHPCKFQLEKSYNFRKKCEHSDMKLRMHLRDLKFKFGSTFVETESCSETQSSDMQIDLNSEEASQGDNAQSQSEQVSTEEDLVGNSV